MCWKAFVILLDVLELAGQIYKHLRLNALYFCSNLINAGKDIRKCCKGYCKIFPWMERILNIKWEVHATVRTNK